MRGFNPVLSMPFLLALSVFSALAVAGFVEHKEADIIRTLLLIACFLLWAACLLLWEIRSAPRIFPANSTEWVILRWHDLIAGDSQGTYKPDSPLYLRFVPIIGWNYKNDGHRKYICATPITPPRYQRAIEMLNDGFPKDGDKTATFGYCIRDGVIFDIEEMTDSGLWESLYDAAFDGIDIEIHGGIPDYYKSKVEEICAISRVERCKMQAKDGKNDAQYQLGLMYANGRDVNGKDFPKNLVNAHMWLNLAAAQGNLTAQDNRDIIAEEMTPAQIAEAQRLAREWKPKGEG
ncbi:MAG: hypothetical protein ACLQVJ_05585 [Syntrophobacteraceae bacterium]